MLGDAETEHQKFTMDPGRTPQKFRGPSYDQMSDYAGNPQAPAAPAPPCSYRQSADPPSRRQRKTVSERTMIRLSRHCGHQRENKVPKGESTGDEFGCARTRRFDGAALSIPLQRSEALR